MCRAKSAKAAKIEIKVPGSFATFALFARLLLRRYRFRRSPIKPANPHSNNPLTAKTPAFE